MRNLTFPPERPGPPAPRRLTPAGKMFVAGAVVLAVFLVVSILILVPSRFGFGG